MFVSISVVIVLSLLKLNFCGPKYWFGSEPKFGKKKKKKKERKKEEEVKGERKKKRLLFY